MNRDVFLTPGKKFALHKEKTNLERLHDILDSRFEGRNVRDNALHIIEIQ